VNDDLVIAAAGLPAFQIAVPQNGHVRELVLLEWALALDVLRIDDQVHIRAIDDGTNRKLASEVTATLAADPKELYDLSCFRELAHGTSPTRLANYPAEA
jgi:hypothetical protein